MFWTAPLAAATPSPMSATQWGVLSAAALLVIYIVLRSSRNRKRDPLGAAPPPSLAQQRAVERQMSAVLVELSEMAREITAKLDTRSAKLAQLIDDADDKTARLQRLLDDCRAALATPAPATPLAAPAEVPPSLPPALPGLAPAADPPSVEFPEASALRHRTVYELSDQGRSASEIARQIDRPRGEIDLILALRPR